MAKKIIALTVLFFFVASSNYGWARTGYQQAVFHIQNISEGGASEYYIKTSIPKEAVNNGHLVYDIQLDKIDSHGSKEGPVKKVPNGTIVKSGLITVRTGGYCCNSLKALSEDVKAVSFNKSIERVSKLDLLDAPEECFYEPENKYEVDVEDLYCAYYDDQKVKSKAFFKVKRFLKSNSKVNDEVYYCETPLVCAKTNELELIREMAQPAYQHINNKWNPRGRQPILDVLPDGVEVITGETARAPMPENFAASVASIRDYENQETMRDLFSRASGQALQLSLVALMSMYEQVGTLASTSLYLSAVCGSGRASQLENFITGLSSKKDIPEIPSYILSTSIDYYISNNDCPTSSRVIAFDESLHELKTALGKINTYCNEKTARIAKLQKRKANILDGLGPDGNGIISSTDQNRINSATQTWDASKSTYAEDQEIEAILNGRSSRAEEARLVADLLVTKYGKLVVTDAFQENVGDIDFSKCSADLEKPLNPHAYRQVARNNTTAMFNTSLSKGEMMPIIRNSLYELRSKIFVSIKQIIQDEKELYATWNIYANTEDWSSLDWFLHTIPAVAFGKVVVDNVSEESKSREIHDNRASKLFSYLKGYPFALKQYIQGDDFAPPPNSREFLLNVNIAEKLIKNDRIDQVKDYLVMGGIAVVCVVSMFTPLSPLGVALTMIIPSAVSLTNVGYNISQANFDKALYTKSLAIEAMDPGQAYQMVEQEIAKIDQNIENAAWEIGGLTLIGVFAAVKPVVNIYKEIKATKDYTAAIKVLGLTQKQEEAGMFFVRGLGRGKSITNEKFLYYLNKNKQDAIGFSTTLGALNEKEATTLISKINNIGDSDQLFATIIKQNIDDFAKTNKIIKGGGEINPITKSKDVDVHPSKPKVDEPTSGSIDKNKGTVAPVTQDTYNNISPLSNAGIRKEIINIVDKSGKPKVYMGIDENGRIYEMSHSDVRISKLGEPNKHMHGSFTSDGKFIKPKTKMITFTQGKAYYGGKKAFSYKLHKDDSFVTLINEESVENFKDILQVISMRKEKIFLQFYDADNVAKEVEFLGLLRSPDNFFAIEHIPYNTKLSGTLEETGLLKSKKIFNIDSKEDGLVIRRFKNNRFEYHVSTGNSIEPESNKGIWNVLSKGPDGNYSWSETVRIAEDGKLKLVDNGTDYLIVDADRRLITRQKGTETGVTINGENIEVERRWSKTNELAPDPNKSMSNILNSSKDGSEIDIFVGFDNAGKEKFSTVEDFMSKLTSNTQIITVDAQRANYLYAKFPYGATEKEIYVFGKMSNHPKPNTEAATLQPIFDATYGTGKVTLSNCLIYLVPTSSVGALFVDDK